MNKETLAYWVYSTCGDVQLAVGKTPNTIMEEAHAEGRKVHSIQHRAKPTSTMGWRWDQENEEWILTKGSVKFTPKGRYLTVYDMGDVTVCIPDEPLEGGRIIDRVEEYTLEYITTHEFAGMTLYVGYTDYSYVRMDDVIHRFNSALVGLVYMASIDLKIVERVELYLQESTN